MKRNIPPYGSTTTMYLVNEAQDEEEHAPKGVEEAGEDAEAVAPGQVVHPRPRHPVAVVAHLGKHQRDQEHQESCK